MRDIMDIDITEEKVVIEADGSKVEIKGILSKKTCYYSGESNTGDFRDQGI